MTPPKKITVVEVGPRDGLQNETRTLTVTARVALINKLADAGLRIIEAGSFVPQGKIPQLANSGEVLKKIKRADGVAYPVLTPNLRGLTDALAAGATEVAVFAAASETFSRRNINCGVDESVERFADVAEHARDAGVKVRGYVSCALGCPFEGEVAAAKVARVAKLLHDLGCYEISLGDTIGVGTPNQARAMVERVAGEVPLAQLAAHFHDTYGQALANLYAVIQLGVSVVDSAVAGLGGCPFAGGGASGNVATEDVVYMLDGLGIDSGVALDKLLIAGDYVCAQLGRANQSKVARALSRRP